MKTQFGHAKVSWTEDGQPISQTHDDVYFSRHSGIEETQYVFLQHNQLEQRWKNIPPESKGLFTIAETGFGTGLNFLCAARLWLETAPENWRLHFISTELFPLTREDLAKALELWPELAPLSAELVDNYPVQIEGSHRVNLFDDRISLTLLFGEASQMFEQLRLTDYPHLSDYNRKVDAWFLDGFAPSKNPDMWTGELFSIMADLSRPGTTFATFTAAGIVKRGLKSAGFTIRKVPGFGHKREMLCGEFTSPQEFAEPAASNRNASHEAPWYLPANLDKENLPDKVAVIGGGIAGCSVANALARRGIQVTLIERHQELGSEASGNPQGIIYPKLSKQDSVLSRYGLHSLAYAQNFYREIWHSDLGDKTGVLVVPENEKQALDFIAIGERFRHQQDFVQLLDNQQIAEVSGLALQAETALYCPNLGWVHPPLVCRLLAQHPNITRLNGEVCSLDQGQDGSWQLQLNNQDDAISCSHVVIACGIHANRFSQTSHLPLKTIRGQVSVIDGNPALKIVVCGAGYIAPQKNGSMTLGATYNLKDNDPELRAMDHEANFSQITKTDPGLVSLLPDDATNCRGRVGFRCTTPDYLPIVGQVPDQQKITTEYAALAKNAKATIPYPGSYLKGLYISCGFGSRGLSYAPLGAELLASQICSEPPPLERKLVNALSCTRFIIREIKRSNKA